MSPGLPRRIKVMTDYETFPLWDIGPSGPAPIDPRGLPIRPSLILAFEAWQQWYDETLNHHDPAKSGFDDANQLSLFVEEGKQLARRLAIALHSQAEVVFFDPRDSTLYPVSSD